MLVGGHVLLISDHVLLEVAQVLVPLLLQTLGLLALQLHLWEDPGSEGEWWLASRFWTHSLQRAGVVPCA